ncbi:MAG: carbamoyltransferase [Gemmatimonadetes bacterium]|nr:carbamoyltransferase [Gemmatimonadota bacterium]
MRILGIQGGISGGAALVEDGRLIRAVNEERLVRLKMAKGFPTRSIRWLLQDAGWAPESVDLVSYAGRRTFYIPEVQPWPGWLTGRESRRDLAASLTPFLGWSDGLWMGMQRGRNAASARNRPKLRRLLADLGVRAPMDVVDHHLAHVCGAWFTAGLPDATLITMDGGGDGYASKVYRARDGRLEELHATTTFNSIGDYYAYVTILLGFKAQKHEGKITGLAAYGSPIYADFFRTLIDYRDGRIVNRGRAMYWDAIRKIRAGLPADAKREDVAASIQRVLEDVVAEYCRYWIRRSGVRDVVLSGGVFSNVKLNQRIHELDEVDELVVHPGMTDEGLGVGAAYTSLYERGGADGFAFEERRLPDVYLGPRYSDREMEAAVRASGLPHSRPASLAGDVADLLVDGKVVALFQGRMEYGPRALGNRSIMYQATDPAVNDWLNQRLDRTEFMPFAPVTRVEDAARCYLGLAGAEYTARFMTVTFDCTSWMKERMPAVVHVDGTARPQLIEQARNPLYHGILSEYERRTGLNSLVNTSFNMHEEPIVCSPEDALRSFTRGHLDHLVLGPFLVENGTPDAKPFHAAHHEGLARA